MSLLVFAIAFVATFFGSVSGSSASIISIPCWLSLGFPLPTAVGCDKVGATFWTLLAARNYLSGKKIDFVLLAGLSIFGIVGVYFGTQITSGINSAVTKPIVGLLIFLAILLSWVKKDFALTNSEPKLNKFVCSFFGLPLGFYEGFFGSGNSIFTSLALCKARGFDLLTALGHYYFVAFIWCMCAAISYSLGGFLNWQLTLPSVIGSIAGGYIGSKLGRRIGAKSVKILFTILGFIFGSKLLLGL